MPTVLTGEVLNEVTVAIQPKTPNGSSWTIGAALTVVVDSWRRGFKVLDSARVDAGQEYQANRKPTKYDTTCSMKVKGQFDDYTTGKLRALLETYDFYRVTVYSGGGSRQYDLLNASWDEVMDENSAVMIEMEFEYAN